MEAEGDRHESQFACSVPVKSPQVSSLDPQTVEAFLDFWSMGHLCAVNERNKTHESDALFGANDVVALKKIMMKQDDAMHAAFAATLDPRFEQRFLRLVREEAKEAKATVAKHAPNTTSAEAKSIREVQEVI